MLPIKITKKIESSDFGDIAVIECVMSFNAMDKKRVYFLVFDERYVKEYIIWKMASSFQKNYHLTKKMFISGNLDNEK